MPNQLYYVQNTTNLGDAVNPAIFQAVLDIRVDSASHSKADVFGIGKHSRKSVHSRLGPSPQAEFESASKLLAKSEEVRGPPCEGHSSSLAADSVSEFQDGRNDLRGYRTYRPIAVRGKLTREVLVSTFFLQMELDEIALGDLSGLMNRLIKNQPVKKYKLGHHSALRRQTLKSTRA